MTKRVDRIARNNAAPPSRNSLKISYLPPERLHRAVTNARTHSKKQLGQIAQSIERFGFVNPVLISDEFEIIAGHGPE
jgi:ParB-like chromosome segregation protein Spo0J